MLKSVRSPRVSAYSIGLLCNPKKPEACISVFILLEGESFDHQEELSDDFGTAHGPFPLVGETVVSRQVMQKEPEPKFQLFMAES